MPRKLSACVLSSRAKNSISEMTKWSEYVSPVWSPEMIGNREGFGVGGTWLQLMCCAASRRHIPNFERQGSGQISEIGDDFVVRQKSNKDDKEGIPSRGARRGLKRIMLREDYVEDKSRFELRKHTGVCTTYKARGLYEKRTKDYPSPEGFVDV